MSMLIARISVSMLVARVYLDSKGLRSILIARIYVSI